MGLGEVEVHPGVHQQLLTGRWPGHGEVDGRVQDRAVLRTVGGDRQHGHQVHRLRVRRPQVLKTGLQQRLGGPGAGVDDPAGEVHRQARPDHPGGDQAGHDPGSEVQLLADHEEDHLHGEGQDQQAEREWNQDRIELLDPGDASGGATLVSGLPPGAVVVVHCRVAAHQGGDQAPGPGADRPGPRVDVSRVGAAVEAAHDRHRAADEGVNHVAERIGDAAALLAGASGLGLFGAAGAGGAGTGSRGQLPRRGCGWPKGGEDGQRREQGRQRQRGTGDEQRAGDW